MKRLILCGFVLLSFVGLMVFARGGGGGHGGGGHGGGGRGGGRGGAHFAGRGGGRGWGHGGGWNRGRGWGGRGFRRGWYGAPFWGVGYSGFYDYCDANPWDPRCYE